MKYLLILLFGAIVTSCTAYQPSGITGGYTEIKLAQNVYRVSFSGNGYTSPVRANDFALLRSAELTLENGFNYFVIVDADKYSTTSSYTTQTTADTTINMGSNGSGTARTTINGGNVYYVAKPTSSNTFFTYIEKPQGFSYNANYVVRSITGTYGIKRKF